MAPFSRDRDDPRRDGPLRRRAAGQRRDRALAVSAKLGEVVRFYLTNTANTRVFKVALPGARMKLVGGDSGHVEHERVRRRRGAGAVGAGGGRRAVRPGRRAGARAPHARPRLPAGRDHGQRRAGRAVARRAVRAPAHQRRHGRRARADRALPGGRARQDPGLHRRDGHGGAGRGRARRLRLPDAPRGGQRGARPLPEVRDEAAAGRGSRDDLHLPDAPRGRERRAGPLPEVRDEAAAGAARRRGRRRPRARGTSTRHHDHARRPTGSSGKTTWSRSTG